MPKIIINEKDLTSSGAYLAIENVVYIPGFSSLELADELIGVPTLCKTVEDFTSKFGTSPKQLSAKDDKSFIMAYELLKLGMFVLYEVPKTDAVELTAVATVDEMEDALEVAGFWTRLTDRGLFNIRFMTSGAYAKGTTAVITAMLEATKARGDAVALIDHASSLLTKTAVQSFFTTAVGTDVNSKFGAGFTPWVHIQSDMYKAAVVDDLLPGSHAYLAAFALSVQSNPSWLAIAGSTRGKIPGLVSPFVSIKYGELEANDLQSRVQGAITINPVCNITPYGFILWGNRTLLPVGSGTVQQDDLVASNFLNIRNIVASIKKTLFVASRAQTFEQNDDILWINFKAMITPLLDQMKTGNGIADYRLIKQKATKKAQVKAIIRIVPIEAVEDFDLTIEMSDSIETVIEQ